MADTQAGVRPTRLEWVQESTEGQAPSDPSWNLFSDAVQSAWGWEPDANTQRQDATGEATAQGFFNGAETHEIEFEYHLQQWYVDGSDNTVDAGGDFLRPGTDNGVRNTHTIVGRSIQSDGGAASAGRRIYTVAKGAHPATLDAPFETEDGSPISQTLAYQAEKIRQYDISQPSSSTTLDVSSSDSGDTSQDVTIEDEGAGTTETVTLTGTSTVSTTASFGDIDAVELSAETTGDVTVSDGSNDLVVIRGQDHYPAGEGDLGVPALGSGSHASAIGSSYVRFLDDTLSIPNVESDVEIISGGMEVDTGLGNDAPNPGTARRGIYAEEWTYTVTATLAGSKVSVDQTVNYLGETTGTITWTADEGSIDWNSAFIQSPGEYTKEAGNGKLQLDNEFEAEDVTVSN